MVANFTTHTLRLNREQALRQLELLGDKPDKVYLTAFFPKGDPRTKGENRDKGRKATSLNYSEVEAWQAQGRGVYLVANGYGHGKEDVKLCRTIFYEHDNLEKDIQLTLWQSLRLPEPTFQVDSGGKSIHSYWVLEEPIHPELWAFQEPNGQWKGLQADLLELADADRSLVNPNRVMRLAGAWYFTHDENGTHPVAQSRIVGGSGKRYSYAELRGIIPRSQPTFARPLSHNQEASGEGLLDFRKVGHLLPHWDERGRKGWATFQCPVHTSDGATHSTDQIHVNCNTGQWEAHCGCDRKLIYQTVCDMVGHKPTGRGFSGGMGGGIGSGGGNRRGNGGAGGSGGDGGDGGDGGNGKVVKFPGFEPLSVEQVTEEIDKLVANGATGSYLTGQLNRLAAASQYYVGELRKLYYERLGESDLECDRDNNRTEVETLLSLNDESLNLADYLPEDLATPITAWCEWLSIRPAVALTALLAGASSLHKVGTELILHKNQNFTVPPTIYSALVSPSGQRKSPVFRNIIRQPLGHLRKEKIDAYNAAMEDYEAELEHWENSKDKADKPEKPKEPTLYYFTNATGEAIPVQASKAPEKALLALIDELSGLLKSENSYRGGRGSDKQDLLSYFDGAGQTVLRAGGIRVDLDKIYLSMFGTVQPEVLKAHMADCSDPDGQWARFLFVNQPLAAATLADDDGMAVQISDRIADFYRRIDRLPEMEYRLSHQAFKRYQPVYEQLERLRVTNPKSGMAAVYSKMEGYIGRLALNLHVLWELAAGKAVPDEEIPLFIMEMAIQLAKFYMGQVRLMHANADDESLPTHILKMIELSKRLETYSESGWLKAKHIQDMFTGKKRPSAQTTREWMNEAVALGLGRTRGKGNRLEYHWLRDNNTSPDDSPSPQNLRNLGNSLGTLKEDVAQLETTLNQDFQENLRNLRKDSPTSQVVVEEENLTEDMPPQMESPPPEIDLEGGSVPLPSPTIPQERCDDESVDVSDLGNNLRNPSLTLPQVPQVCDSSAQTVTVEAPPLPELAQASTTADPMESEEANPVGIAPINVPDAPDPTTLETNIQQFQAGDRVMTPQGEGVILYFNESWDEYSVSLESSTDYFKCSELNLLL